MVIVKTRNVYFLETQNNDAYDIKGTQSQDI